jgi:hypothetical protein
MLAYWRQKQMPVVLARIDPNTLRANLSDSVQFWTAADPLDPTSHQQILTEYFYNQLRTYIPQLRFTIVGHEQICIRRIAEAKMEPLIQ